MNLLIGNCITLLTSPKNFSNFFFFFSFKKVTHRSFSPNFRSLGSFLLPYAKKKTYVPVPIVSFISYERRGWVRSEIFTARLSLLFCIRKVLGSNLCRYIGCPDRFSILLHDRFIHHPINYSVTIIHKFCRYITQLRKRR
jgi:hypothetical protein